MKKILVLTAVELKDHIERICRILRERYNGKFQVEDLRTMDEEQVADYVYIIITERTFQEEIDLLMGTALMWTDDQTVSISYLRFSTIQDSAIKTQRRREAKLRRRLPILWDRN